MVAGTGAVMEFEGAELCTVTGVETLAELVLPTWSAAIATTSYAPSAGWLFHATEYGDEPVEVPMSVPFEELQTVEYPEQ